MMRTYLVRAFLALMMLVAVAQAGTTYYVAKTGNDSNDGSSGSPWLTLFSTAGHRLSTGAMEEVLASHPDVAECAVIGVADEVKGQVPLGLLVLKAGVERPHDEIVAEVVRLVRERIGPVAAFKTAAVVERLPKTRSGKILRGTMRRIADGEEYTTPATIDDPAVLDEVGEVLRRLGYAPAQATSV